jgi:hypothetical protein
MSLAVVARLIRDYEEGRRSPKNIQLAIEAYQGFLGQEATNTVALVLPPDSPECEALLENVQQIFEAFWTASEYVTDYALRRNPNSRNQAMKLASEADELLRELIWQTYDRATRSFYAG